VQKRTKGEVAGAKDYRRYLLATITPARINDIAGSMREDPLAAGRCPEFLQATLEAYSFDAAYYERIQLKGLGGE